MYSESLKFPGDWEIKRGGCVKDAAFYMGPGQIPAASYLSQISYSGQQVFLEHWSPPLILPPTMR